MLYLVVSEETVVDNKNNKYISNNGALLNPIVASELILIECTDNSMVNTTNLGVEDLELIMDIYCNDSYNQTCVFCETNSKVLTVCGGCRNGS